MKEKKVILDSFFLSFDSFRFLRHPARRRAGSSIGGQGQVRAATGRLTSSKSSGKLQASNHFFLGLLKDSFSISICITMNKGIGGAGGVGGGTGPTAAAAATAAQKQKVLLQRVDNDIANIVDNFTHLVNVSRVNDPPVRNSQECFMMEMRAARMVQAADSLLKLVSELKQTAIFSGFASLNDHVEQRIVEFNQQAEQTDRILSRIGEEAAASLNDLESHYYSSTQRTSQNMLT